MRRVFHCLLLLAIICLVPACSNLNQDKQRTLRLNLSNDPNSFDPRESSEVVALTVSKMLFDGLTRLNNAGRPELSVAKSVQVSDDGKIYTFVLKKTLWSNGDPVTAHDFEYAWKSVLRPQSTHEYATTLYTLKNGLAAKLGMVPLEQVGVHATDAYTLVVELEHPAPYFLELAALPTFSPIHRQIDRSDATWSQKPGASFISNGPFSLVAWNLNDSLTVAKNPLYWDAEHVKLEKIAMSVISDATTELLLFEKGDLDWAGSPLSSLPSESVPQLLQEGRLETFPVAGTVWFKFNTDQAPFQNAKMRRAFSYAINRDAIVNYVVPAHLMPATGPLPPCMALRSSPYFQDGDLDAAQQLFAEALAEMNVAKKDLPPVTITYRQSEKIHRIVQAIQQQWRSAFGVSVKLEAVEFKVLLSRMAQHDYQVGIKMWLADFSDPTSFLEIFKYKDDPVKGGNNETQWESPDYIFLLNEASCEANPGKRKELLQQAEEILVKDMPVAPIYYQTATYVKRRAVKNVILPPAGPADFKWATLE